MSKKKKNKFKSQIQARMQQKSDFKSPVLDVKEDKEKITIDSKLDNADIKEDFSSDYRRIIATIIIILVIVAIVFLVNEKTTIIKDFTNSLVTFFHVNQ